MIGLICRGAGHPGGNEGVPVPAAESPAESLKFNRSGSQRATGVRTMRWPSGATGALSARGAQEKQAPTSAFQQLSQAYCRHVMQKWKAL
jgi:hypothetical protein